MAGESPTSAALFTDAELRALSLDQRHELSRRIARLPGGHPGVHLDPRKLRRQRVAVLVVCAAVLVPWTVYLGTTLPNRYVVDDWTLTWTGFDVILTIMFAVTGYLAFRGRQIVVISSFTSGILLLCDAWFDVTTSSGGDRLVAIAFAVLAELPVATYLIYAALHLLSLTLHSVRPDIRLPMWRVPILIAENGAGPNSAPGA